MVLTAVYMKEKFRELRSFYEKSITAGDGAFIPTPLTAPSPRDAALEGGPTERTNRNTSERNKSIGPNASFHG